MIIKNLTRGEIEIEDAAYRLHMLTAHNNALWEMIFAAIFPVMPDFGDYIFAGLKPAERYLSYLPDEINNGPSLLQLPICTPGADAFHSLANDYHLHIIGKLFTCSQNSSLIQSW